MFVKFTLNVILGFWSLKYLMWNTEINETFYFILFCMILTKSWNLQFVVKLLHFCKIQIIFAVSN